MLLLLFLSPVLLCTLACDGVVNSPSEQFQDYLHHTNTQFSSPKERVLRYKLFSQNLHYISELNSQNLGYTAAPNKFALMSHEEVELYHGVNRTLEVMAHDDVMVSDDDVIRAAPASVSWVDQGHVTSVKNQDGCGACWTFGPTVAIEGAYKKLTGKLKQFSNQELLDCVYDAHTYNACYGGLESRAFQFVINRRRLALWRHYPYEPVDKKCRAAGKHNGLVAAKVTGYSVNKAGEEGTIARLSQGPLSVAFHAVLSVHFYKEGIYRSDKCNEAANHAVAAVAYTPQYILIKNSWGADWGDQGLFKFARHDHACGIHLPDNNFMVQMETTGTPDSDSEDTPLVFNQNPTKEPPTQPKPNTTPVTKPVPTTDSDNTCRDKKEGCMEMFCNFYESYKKDCRKTCGLC